MRKEERYERILAHFRAQMPEVTTELEFGSVFQLLVAVVLSAQCTDKRINQVTPELFRHFPDAKTMAQAEPEEVSSEAFLSGFSVDTPLSSKETKGVPEIDSSIFFP